MCGMKKAIELAGGQERLAKLLGVKQGHVYYWYHYRVPPNRIQAIVEALGWRVSAEELKQRRKQK